MRRERGGFAMGLIVGLLLGLALALGVALYVTKVPVPFVNKVPQRTAEQDAAEAERNKHWDPNAGLSGKGATKSPTTPASAPAAVGTAPPAPAAMPAPVIAGRPASGPGATPARPSRDPAAILAGQDPAAAPKATPGAPAASMPSKSTKPAGESFVYFVQAGAYAREEDAEQQRAKLAMMGFAAKITEREQSGRPVFRVRLGPYEDKNEADAAQARLQASGSEAALVRIVR